MVSVFLPDGSGRLVPRAGSFDTSEGDASEREVIEWVYKRSQVAGLGTGTLPGARALYLPLVASRGPIGVLGVRPATPHPFAAPEQLHLLETFAAQTALAIERAKLAEEAQQAEFRIESERGCATRS